MTLSSAKIEVLTSYRKMGMRASMKWDQGSVPETDIQYSSAPIRRYLMRERTADVHTQEQDVTCAVHQWSN